MCWSKPGSSSLARSLLWFGSLVAPTHHNQVAQVNASIHGTSDPTSIRKICYLNYQWVFPKKGLPENGWFKKWENRIKMDALGVPLGNTPIKHPPGFWGFCVCLPPKNPGFVIRSWNFCALIALVFGWADWQVSRGKKKHLWWFQQRFDPTYSFGRNCAMGINWTTCRIQTL